MHRQERRIAVPGAERLEQPEAMQEGLIPDIDVERLGWEDLPQGPDHRSILPAFEDLLHAPALGQRLLVFGLGVGVGDDPAADLIAGPIPLDEDGPDRDVEPAGSTPTEVA